MTALDETRLRGLLQEQITERYEVTEIFELEDELNAQGQPIPHRESGLRRYEGRLARLRQIAPDRTDMPQDHEAGFFYGLTRPSVRRPSSSPQVVKLITFGLTSRR